MDKQPRTDRQTGIEYEFAFAVHAISDNRYVRHVGPDAGADRLGNDEYYAIYLTIHNHSDRPLSYSSSVLKIDGTSLPYGGRTIAAGKAYSMYLPCDRAKTIPAGERDLSLTLDGERVFSRRFTMPKTPYPA